MNNAEQLIKDFPELMGHVRCGIEHPCGWNRIVRELCDELDGCQITCDQTKSKFGGLRFGINFTSEDVLEEERKRIHNLISIAESKSFRTCEECGCPGNGFKIGGWLWTLCYPCAVHKYRDQSEYISRHLDEILEENLELKTKLKALQP